LSDLAALRPTEIVRLVSTGEVSPVEVIQSALDRVERYNPTLNAVVTPNERALDDARDLEASLATGAQPGPLCGVPVGIKDITDVAGLRTTYGSPLYIDNVPDADALVVERLRNAGAIILGKTNTPEFAAGGNTFNEVFGRTRNPWNPALSAGGSTGGGAAALASGMIGVAEGTDLGGSLRIPASFCGLVGIRPSPGLVPTYPTAWPWDDLAVTGPMARTAEDVALALQVMAGPDPRSPMKQPMNGRDFVGTVAGALLKGLRLAYCPDIVGLGIDASIEERCRSVVLGLADAGAHVEAVDLTFADSRKAFLHLRGVWMVAHMREHMDRLAELGGNVRGNIEAGLKVTTRQVAWAHAVRGRMWAFFDRFFERHDFLLTPSMAVSPFPVEQNYPETVGGRAMKTYVDWIAPTFTLSLTGLPVASVPCGLDAHGLPVGLQVVGPPLGEERVLGLCRLIQEAYPIGGPYLEALEISSATSAPTHRLGKAANQAYPRVPESPR
jgi:amidase